MPYGIPVAFARAGVRTRGGAAGRMRGQAAEAPRRSAARAISNDPVFGNQTLDASVTPGKTPVHRSALSNTYRQYALECDNAKGRHRSHP